MPALPPSPVISAPLVHRREESAAPEPAVQVSPPHRILFATMGGPGDESAARTAAAIARRHDASVHVVSVFTPRIGYPRVTGDGERATILPSDRPGADAQLDAVQRLLASTVGPDAQWRTELVVGHPGPQVARVASTSRADLVVIGGGRPRADERPLGDRGALAIAACIDVPLLAVSAGFAGAPRRVMFAIGLDPCSLRAVAMVVATLPEPESLMLAHARVHSPGAEGVQEEDPEAVAARIAEARAVLAPWRAAKAEVVLLGGDPLQALFALARQHEVDLVVGGLHGGSYDQRAHARNLMLRLLADAECSVLLLPPAPHAPAPTASSADTAPAAQ